MYGYDLSFLSAIIFNDSFFALHMIFSYPALMFCGTNISGISPHICLFFNNNKKLTLRIDVCLMDSRSSHWVALHYWKNEFHWRTSQFIDLRLPVTC